MITKTKDVKQVFEKMWCSPQIRFLVGLVAESEENEHFDELTGFKCPVCDFVGKNMWGLKVHMTRKHLNKVSSNAS